MGPRKSKSDKGNDSNKKMGRPSGNPIEDSHPRLLTNYMKTQPMVYDSSIETPRNKVEYMLSQCQKSIDDKNTTWAFMLRQLVDVFIMAFDKLKSRSDDLTSSAHASSCPVTALYSAAHRRHGLASDTVGCGSRWWGFHVNMCSGGTASVCGCRSATIIAA